MFHSLLMSHSQVGYERLAGLVQELRFTLNSSLMGRRSGEAVLDTERQVTQFAPQRVLQPLGHPLHIDVQQQCFVADRTLEMLQQILGPGGVARAMFKAANGCAPYNEGKDPEAAAEFESCAQAAADLIAGLKPGQKLLDLLELGDSDKMRRALECTKVGLPGCFNCCPVTAWTCMSLFDSHLLHSVQCLLLSNGDLLAD